MSGAQRERVTRIAPTQGEVGRRSSSRAGRAAVALSFAATGASATEPAGGVPLPEQSCQRACHEGFLDKYLQAMPDGKVDPDLFAPNARFTENGVQLPLGNEG